MDKAFEFWMFNGVRFIAFPNGCNVAVMDEDGNNYGGWSSTDDFRKAQRGKLSDYARTLGATEPIPCVSLGRMKLSGTIIKDAPRTYECGRPLGA